MSECPVGWLGSGREIFFSLDEEEGICDFAFRIRGGDLFLGFRASIPSNLG